MYSCSDHKSCLSDALHIADKICQQKGLRFTSLRKIILEMIWSNHEPSKAYDILDKLKDVNLSAKPSTVYRTLDFLLENGLIHKLNSLNAYIGCSHPLEHNECFFLFCQECKEIKECCNKELAKAINQTASNNKFQPMNVILEIQGECQECAGKARL